MNNHIFFYKYGYILIFNCTGFEETQSLMSESPSQGASSAGNYETDIVDSAQNELTDFSRIKPVRASSLESKGTSDSTGSESQAAPITKSTTSRLAKPVSQNRASTLVQRFSNNFDRTNPTRHTVQDIGRKSVIPKRSDSMRKTDLQPSVPKQNSKIKKSNSRNSLVSSRSSLNSTTSTNTVKRIPLKPANTNITTKTVTRTPSIKSLSNTKSTTTNLRRAPSINNSITTTQKPPRPQGLSSFMKPTASSSTKTNTPTIQTSRLQFPTYRSKN